MVASAGAVDTATINSNGGPIIVSAASIYDGGNRLTNQTDATTTNPNLHTYVYTYDAAGNPASLTADGATTSYTYDTNHQLTGETTGSSSISYAYDAYHNRATMTVGSSVTTYHYQAAADPTELTSVSAPDGSTAYTYTSSGDLATAALTPAGGGSAQTTSYRYDSANRLNGVTLPDGTAIAYTYDANGQRASASVTPPGGGAASVVDDYYQWGRLAYQTTGAGTLLARYTYDLTGAPVSVQVGSDPTTAPRYYYVYDARGDVVNLTDATGATVASYSYDTWGALTASSEAIPNANGWVNPYRYDGRDRVLADPATGLDWLATRAYDPSIGRFLARDPLGRAPLFFADNPYAYAGNNPVSNVDPSGQYRAAGAGSTARESGAATNAMMARVVAQHGTPSKGCGGCKVVAGAGASGTKVGATAACASIDVPCLLLHLDWSKVNWGEVAQGAGIYLGGTMSLAAGIFALGVLLTNPGAFFAQAALVTFLGGSPATAFFAVFALITAGLSFMVHGLATVLSGVGIMNGVLATLFTLVEGGMDALAVGIGAATLATTAAGLLTGIGGIFSTFIGLATTLSTLGNLLQTFRNEPQVLTCDTHPAQSCPIG